MNHVPPGYEVEVLRSIDCEPSHVAVRIKTVATQAINELKKELDLCGHAMTNKQRAAVRTAIHALQTLSVHAQR